jgi:hypothetical protein
MGASLVYGTLAGVLNECGLTPDLGKIVDRDRLLMHLNRGSISPVLGEVRPHVVELALPKSFEISNLSLNKDIIQWMSDMQNPVSQLRDRPTSRRGTCGID